VVLRQTPRAVTPFGVLRVFIEFLRKVGFSCLMRENLPVHLDSPNAIPPAETYTAFLISVLAGARRMAYTSLVRADRALHALLGIKRFRQKIVYEFFEPFWARRLVRLPKRPGATVWIWTRRSLSATGNRRGVKKGYNRRKPGARFPSSVASGAGGSLFRSAGLAAQRDA
jgi:hypothetical protein